MYIGNDPELTARQRRDFQAHLQACPACARDYQDSKFAIDLVGQYWTVDEDAIELQQETDVQSPAMTVQQSWQDLLNRCPDLALCVRRQKRLRLFHQAAAVAAIAASVALVVTFGWMFFSKPQSQVSLAASKPVQHKVFAELVTASDKQALPLGQPVTTKDQRQEVMLGGMHRVVMNRQTAATFHADPANGNYQIQLARGQLYVEVVPGHRFTVKTPNARLIIIGTKFDVRYQDGRTDLTLAKGSVRFGNSKDQWTDVSAGYASTIVHDTSPTTPTKADTLAATAWTRDTDVASNTAGEKSKRADKAHGDLLAAISTYIPPLPPDLEELDYHTWTKENRNLFATSFPWIFQLEEALAKAGIKVTYPELLIQSGDIWQFVCPAASATRIPVLDPESLVKVALRYGFNQEWLFEAVPGSGIASVNHGAAEEVSSGAEAFERWAGCFEKARRLLVKPDSSTLCYSLDASIYIARSRSLAWLCVRRRMCDSKDQDKSEFSSLLHKQIEAAHNTLQITIQLMKAREMPCSSDYVELIEEMITNIAVLGDCEKRIYKYEIGK